MIFSDGTRIDDSLKTACVMNEFFGISGSEPCVAVSGTPGSEYWSSFRRSAAQRSLSSCEHYYRSTAAVLVQVALNRILPGVMQYEWARYYVMFRVLFIVPTCLNQTRRVLGLTTGSSRVWKFALICCARNKRGILVAPRRQRDSILFPVVSFLVKSSSSVAAFRPTCELCCQPSRSFFLGIQISSRCLASGEEDWNAGRWLLEVFVCLCVLLIVGLEVYRMYFASRHIQLV